jgi:kynurenine formamidase
MAQRDQTGATRFITPETVVSALHGVKHGKLIDLSHTIHAGVPMMVPFHAPFTLSTWCTPDRTRKMIREAFKVENEIGVITEQVTMGMHTGTHIDALGHISMADEMYGGVSTRDAVGDFGLDFLGIENCPPLVTRGVLFDVAGHRGVDVLDPTDIIRREELEELASKHDLRIHPGDVVLIRTGWSKHFATDNTRYVSSEPGIDEGAAAWLTAQKIVAIGSDNPAVEAFGGPGGDPTKAFPVHQHCLVKSGVHLVENMVLDELAAQKVLQFAFLLLPAKYRGASASPVRPVAVL